MKTKKLESLKKFEVKKADKKSLKGGRANIVWLQEGPAHESFNIGTYVDGMSMGTDGWED